MHLIEKEFLYFGHQFAIRIGISQKDSHNEDQRSPIFLQWLDIIHQLLYQFPEAFEFNMEFLLFLAFHYNSCLYGTFMYNCESERFEKKAKQKTTSIWTDILKSINRFSNNRYNPVEIIIPSSSPYKMRFWEEFFFKYNTSIDRNLNGTGSLGYSVFINNNIRSGTSNSNNDLNNNFKREIVNMKIDEEQFLKNNQENKNKDNIIKSENTIVDEKMQKNCIMNNSPTKKRENIQEEKNKDSETNL